MGSASSYKGRWSVFSLILLAQFALSMGSHGWGPLAPFLKESMCLSNVEVGYITSIFYLASALSAFPAGMIVDSFGVKKGMLLWLGVTGLPLMAMKYTSTNFSLFLVILAMSGMGYGTGNPVASKGLYTVFQRGMRGTVFGLRQCSVTVGGALAGIWLVALSQKIGPFPTLQVVSCLILLVAAVTLFCFPDQRELETEEMGRVGRRSFSMQGLKALLTSGSLFVITLIGMILGLSQGVVGAFLVLYLTDGIGVPRMAGGALFSIMMLGASGARLLWGVMSDKLFHGRRRPVLFLISSLGVLSLFLLGFWSADWPPWLLTPLVLGVGASTWGWNSMFAVMAAETSDSGHTATSLGFTTAFGWLGIASGPMIFGYITEGFGYPFAWMTVAVFCAAAGMLCFRISESGDRETDN
jgi:sugar phosphate permease